MKTYKSFAELAQKNSKPKKHRPVLKQARGGGCSIREQYEQNLNWFQVPLGWDLNGIEIFDNENLLLRCQNSGKHGFDLMQIEENLFAISNVSDGFGECSCTYLVKVASFAEAAKWIFTEACDPRSKKIDHYPIVERSTWDGKMYQTTFDFAISQLLPVQVKVRELFQKNLRPEDVGLRVTRRTSYGEAEGPVFFTTAPDTGWSKSYNSADCVFLTQAQQRVYLAEQNAEKMAAWEFAKKHGGTCVVISCKGMAKTEVPNGTLVGYGTHPNMILPDGTMLFKESYGSGRNFGYSYQKGKDKVDLNTVDLSKYYVAFNEKVGIVDQIFGARHGSAQVIV
jgi:hypothetical protein